MPLYASLWGSAHITDLVSRAVLLFSDYEAIHVHEIGVRSAYTEHCS